MPKIDSNAQIIFAGEFRHALDGKNRVTIPARWRGGDSDEFFLIPNPTKDCLTAMPPAVFQSIGEEAKERIEPGMRQDFIRFFYAKALHTVTDKQGRLLITEEHCKQAGLRGEIILAGARDRFEIWSLSSWIKFNQSLTQYQEVAKLVGL